MLGTFELAAETLPLAEERRLLERAADRVEQIGRRGGFEHVGEGGDAYGRDRPLNGRVASDHHRLNKRRAGPQGREQ